ncbi:MAG TPA: hypothetical protein VIV11_18230 [Kofleriaceae bacterium]
MRNAISITAVLLAACSGCDDETTNAPEYITTVQLAFMPASGTPVMAEFDDPDGDGGNPGTSQPVNLANATTYTLTVKFLNRLETPEEDITPEVSDEGFQHQLFFTGTAVNGPATTNPSAPLTHSYADMDSNGLPVGLTNTIVAATGTGTLTVTLRHMPPELPPEKSADSATQVRTGGFAAIGGSTDAQVDFAVTVQ